MFHILWSLWLRVLIHLYNRILRPHRTFPLLNHKNIQNIQNTQNNNNLEQDFKLKNKNNYSISSISNKKIDGDNNNNDVLSIEPFSSNRKYNNENNYKSYENNNNNDQINSDNIIEITDNTKLLENNSIKLNNNNSNNNENNSFNENNDQKETIVNKNLDNMFIGDSGIIWLKGQNNPVGDPDIPEANLPYLHEQANVLNTILKNADKL